MKAYRATVHLLLPAYEISEGWIADAVSGALSENLKYDGVILDWSYILDAGGRYQSPELVDLGRVQEWDDDRHIHELPLAVAFDHAFDFAFEVRTNASPDAVTATELRTALLERVNRITDDELLQACSCFDTMEEGA
jgi:hypothetical protein